jgi:adenylosuccinate lyase
MDLREVIQLSTDDFFEISPLDGRYFDFVSELSQIFSEFALTRKRVFIEIEYLKAFLREVDINFDAGYLDRIKESFSIEEMEGIKEYEAKTEHDVYAVVEFLKEVVPPDLKTFVHFGLTSEDVNNLCYGLILNEGRKVILKSLKDVIEALLRKSEEYASVSMLSFTHGEPATPTTFGKQFINYAVRLSTLYKDLKDIELEGKVAEATGGYNALSALYPDVDWISFSERFVRGLGLKPNIFVTQILPADSYAKLFDTLKRISSVLIDADRNIWNYFLLGYISLTVPKESVGSSTMPHKINPIKFENSEGNAEVAEAMFGFLSNKLLKSRLQRDLTDSTVKRNIGMSFAYLLLSLKMLHNGLSNIKVQEDKIKEDMANHPEVFSELLQLILRQKGLDAYEEVKKLLRERKEDFLKELDRIVGTESVIKEKFIKGASSKVIEKGREIVKKNISD